MNTLKKSIACALAIVSHAAAQAQSSSAPSVFQVQQTPETLTGLSSLDTTSGFKKEKVTYLGVAMTEPSDDLSRHVGLTGGTGVLAASVVKGSPASKAGIAAHDLLTRIDEQILFTVEQTAALIRSFKPGDKIRVTYLHRGVEKTAMVTLALNTVFSRPQPLTRYISITNTTAFPVFKITNSLPVFTSEITSLLTNNVVFTNINTTVSRQIMKAYEQAASAAATNPLLGHHSVLIKKTGGSAMVQELAEVHEKVKLVVEQSLLNAKVPEKARRKAMADIDRLLKQSVPQVRQTD